MKNLNDFFNNDKFAVHNGVELVEFRHGYANCRMHITEKHQNAFGTIMGGAIFTLADYTLGVAANSYGRLAVSLNVVINYTRPGTGDILYAVAEEITKTSTTGVYQVTVKDQNNDTVSTATGTCYFKKKSIL